MRTLGQYMGASGATFGYAVLPSTASFKSRTLADPLNSQLLHVHRQRNPIRRLPCHATGLHKLAPKPHYHGGRPPSTLLTTRRIVTDRVCGSDIEMCVGRTCRGCRSPMYNKTEKYPSEIRKAFKQDNSSYYLPNSNTLSLACPCCPA